MAEVPALRPVGTPSSLIVANGKSLTVTTANAVATFAGPDLVGFVNALTGESYLKNPSSGNLARVDAITSTGQGLQPSNWAVAAGIATITSSDSVRTLTITVRIDPASQEIVLRSSAGVTTPGVRGASWSIAGIDLAAGKWIVPANSGSVFDQNDPGLNKYLEYPFTWHAQMAVYEATLGSFVLYSTDNQYFFKQLRQTTRGDAALDVAVHTEAVAPFPSQTTVPAVEWRLKAFAGDWRVAAQTFRDWLLANRPPVSNAAHPWVSNIQTVVAMGGRDSTLLAPLAAQVNPSQTMLYLTDWRQYGYDVNYPDYTPGSGAASFVATAHGLGFKVMLHTDLVGVAPSTGDYAAVQQYQTRTPESLQLMGWNWDQPPSTPQRYGIINPASAAFRSLFITRIGAAIATLSPDALHLDFNGSYNDGNGPIEGRSFTQGQVKLHDELVAAFPTVALGGEIETDLGFPYYSFAQGWNPYLLSATPGHPIAAFLFSPQVLYYGHLVTPRVSDPTFKTYLVEPQRRAIFPMWRVDAADDLDTTNLDNARFIGMIQSWQSHAFRPALTADWTGALVRYQGLAGSTAALTDSGTLMTLTGAGSQLFQLAHDVNQLTSTSFVPAWPAFDTATLYGLDPSKQYFLDPVPRPPSTHVTSLPAGIRLGPGTLVGSAFAHIELASPASSVDFEGGLLNSHPGVRFQGVDTPLGNGAIVTPGSIVAGGVSRSGISIQPPWQDQRGGETFVEYSVAVPAGATLGFSVGVADNATCTDGVNFRVTANDFELWHQSVARTGWQNILLDLNPWAGSTVALRLISNPGAANNPDCDWSLWSGVSLTSPPAAVSSVPLALATGSAVAGFDGDGTVSSPAPLTATVANVRVPGAFTVFTQPGVAVSNGTNLTGLPFQVWGAPHGELATPGSVFGAGAVGNAPSGGITKSQTIWAHPPNGGATVLSWVLRLPDLTPLKLGVSAGIGDGALSDDGIDFKILVNGAPYWQLTTQADQWLPGTLDLARWKGQNVLVELVTDSRANFFSDWAYWADLVLSTSATSCSYGLGSASASVDALGGSFSVNVVGTPTCPWSAASNAPWLTIASGSGNGNGTVNYVVAPNAGPARAGTLNIGGQTFTVTQAASTIVTNSPPTISAIVNRSTRRSTPVLIGFTVGDLVGGAANVVVSATSSNPALVPNVNIVGGGAGAARTLTITPALNQLGTTTITVTASTRGLSVSTAFTLLVYANGAIPADYDGDGKTEVAIYRPATGIWYILNSSTNFGNYASYQWGVSTDTPVLGDYDGDGKADVAVYRPATGIWYILLSTTNFASYVAYQWGVSTDVPMPGDYDGDGKTDVAIYRPATGIWYILLSSTNATNYVAYQWGVSTDRPVPGDYDGDGKTDVAVYRPATGIWYILKSSTNAASYVSYQWGVSTDLPVVGDYDGDGKADISVFRPPTGTWYMLQSSTNATSYLSFQWGVPTDLPVAGDFDGDGRTDVGVYRPATGIWYVLRSSTNSTAYVAYQWGVSTDVPLLKRP
jgi:hypothetical protein